MLKMLPLLLASALLLTACAGAPVQSAQSCPPPPPAPEILVAPVSTGPSLTEKFEAHWKIFEQRLAESLKKATLPD